MSMLRKSYRKMTSKLLYKMVLIYSLLTIIPLIFISSMFYIRATNIMETKISDSSSQTLVETADKIDGMFKLVEQRAGSLVDSLPVNRLLKMDVNDVERKEDSPERERLVLNLQEELKNELSANRLLDAIYIFNNDGIAYSSPGAVPVTSYPALTYIAHEMPGRLNWAFFTDHDRVTSSIEIIDEATDRKIGILAIMLKQDELRKAYSLYNSGSFFITNSSNLILSAHDPQQIGNRLKLTTNSERIVFNRTSLYSGFNYFSVISKYKLNKEIADLAYYAYGITFISWCIVFALTVILLRHISDPLTKLTKLMRKAKREHFEEIDGIRTNDEIGQLCNNFNTLIREIQNLIHKVYKAELLRKEADLKAIRMHLNPHFLYNTLESISIMAEKSGSLEVPEMIHMLSRILRFSISEGDEFIPLETELSMAKFYLRLHQYRYRSRLNWEVQCSPELQNIKVPKLILQPIVENAIIHGIDHAGQGSIHIRCYERDYDLWMEVEDNGVGMQHGGKELGGSPGLGTGLNNVSSRIRIHYGEDYGMTRESGLEGGTLVRIRLPITG